MRGLSFFKHQIHGVPAPAAPRRMASASRWLAVFMVVLAVLVGNPSLASQATPAANDRAASVTSATIEFSRTIENERRFDLYDRLHPDARNVFPRQAFFAWLAAGGLSEPADDPVVTDVTFGAWSWPVTGDTYDNAAVVSFNQPVIQNGTMVETSATMVFVPDGLRWRWFPHVEATAIQQFQQQVAEAEPATTSPGFRRAAFVRIDRFWADLFAVAGLGYTPLQGIVPVTSQPFTTGCGLEEDIAVRSIYYCTLDETVYFDPGFQDQVVNLAGAYGFTMIVSHEWAHHIQWDLGITVSRQPELDGGFYPIEIELQADCLAGVYAQDAFATGQAGRSDIQSAIHITSLAGDRRGTDWADWDAHGTGEQRVEAFLTGFDDGLWGCHLDLDSY